MQVRAMPQPEHPLYPAPTQPRVGLKPSYLRSFMLTSSGRLRLASRGVITCEPGSPAPDGPKAAAGATGQARGRRGPRGAAASPRQTGSLSISSAAARRGLSLRSQRATIPTRGLPSLPEASLEPTAGRAGLLRARPRLVHAGARPSWMSLTCAASTSRYRLARAISSSLSRRRSSFSCFACASGQAWG